MHNKQEALAHRKKIRTYSKRLVTTLSTISFIGYIAASIFDISVLSLCCTIASTILSVLSFALNMWSLKDHFRKQDLNKQLGIDNTPGQKKLTKIYLDVTSSVLFLAGGIIPILPFESPIIPFISTTFFILGCITMAANTIHTVLSKPQVEENNNHQNKQCPNC
ncbi:hypothetical protein [Candidatus Wolbachia massiliensis]|uniref:Uncharacterized protein n=1 Tax=Candidatus Wolbachia massiliensis TaxID=1845000 RepID=A0A7M3U2I6_9RICK|nr:hypothetical protein [Candidatus Wolbachia massiliensis]QOD38621.1 hypothetical protein ID128_01965 [Candidatus Wolbachia massiliensis]